MKKVLFGLFALSALASAKEVIAQPVKAAEPVATPAVVAAPAVVKSESKFNIHTKVGVDAFARYQNVDGTASSKVETTGTGYAVEIQGTMNLGANTEFGIGTGYQSHAKKGVNPNNYRTPSYNSIPVYLVGKYNFSPVMGVTPYFESNIGYSFNSLQDNAQLNGEDYATSHISTKDGFYYGAGFGCEYNNITADIMYHNNNAKLHNDISSNEANYNYSRVTFAVGYKFSF